MKKLVSLALALIMVLALGSTALLGGCGFALRQTPPLPFRRIALTGFAASLPGMFIAVLIFLMAWIVTRIASEFFLSVEARPAEDGRLNAHTAPATRRWRP